MRLEIVLSGDTLMINEMSFPFKDKTLTIEDATILTSKTKGISEFDRLIDGILTEQQKLTLLQYLYDNSQVGVKELQTLLDTTKEKIDRVLFIAYDTGIIFKKGQWRLRPDKRNAIGAFIKSKSGESVGNDSFDVIDEPIPYMEEIKHAVTKKKKGKR